ncbi:hypothetical protein GUITHDRAFT_149791 [Guillardia theta CCMP2712]|uniref:Uncharacterized protein n=1 Tax=Guillardia theta (strain CCMP2712) TaxID=905079 RepID=L1K4A6_GUITC|nr:hypothetical protein GUITHDRAFT_149791 [Guillardia theta CCMP2712]EKX55412.1 hypothetical protein GUITHDRAFT_149791 [Guillardia theta CCMP2712]|eukprot:XP_005842392.1 hypothetical protein GUITHDRAFT_149791 [Guillardia theta CCMP2712]
MVAMLATNLGQAEEETTAGRLPWNLASACIQRTQGSGGLRLRGGMGTRMRAFELAKKANLTDKDAEDEWYNALDENQTETPWYYPFYDDVRDENGPWLPARNISEETIDPELRRHPNETIEEAFERILLFDDENKTALNLHYLKSAACVDDYKGVKKIIEEEGIDVNAEIEEASLEKAIHFAAWCGNIKTVEVLLELGADVNAKNCFNQTALHRAAFSGFQQLCEFLVQRGADPLTPDSWDFSPPEWAAANFKNWTCQWFYAKFISNETFPKGPPPHYGLKMNEGFEYFNV